MDETAANAEWYQWFVTQIDRAEAAENTAHGAARVRAAAWARWMRWLPVWGREIGVVKALEQRATILMKLKTRIEEQFQKESFLKMNIINKIKIDS